MKRRTTRSILLTTLAVMVAMATGGAAMAFNPAPTTAAAAAAASIGCDVSYTNGSGASELTWCRSTDGNLQVIEHGDGIDHINAFAAIEGWCVSSGGVINGMTNGTLANVGLEAPNYPHPTKVRHKTTDGELRVESRFSTSPGNKQIVVKMNVRNQTSVPINDVYITRFIDADAGGLASNDWSSTSRSVTATAPGVASLQMFPKTDQYQAVSAIFDSTIDPASVMDATCWNDAADVTTSATGVDGSMAISYTIGTLQPNETATVEFVYRINS